MLPYPCSTSPQICSFRLYDANGNTTHDGRTGQDLAWNELNLIAGVSQGSGAASSTLASYTWMADGAKYASARADGSGYVYKGALVFERNAAGKFSLDAANRWRYSGKEKQGGARMYDPVIARWMSVDPLAEKYYPIQGSLQLVEIIAAFSDICIRAA